MAEVTWIKLNTDMFDNKKIKQIRKMPGGNDMVLFWVMLLTLAGKSNSQGYIFFTETLPYDAEMLANEFDMELNTVKMALNIFVKFNMITVEEETILITGWSDHQNAEGLEKIKEREQAKIRKRKQREKEKLLLAPAKEETCSYENNDCDMSRDSHCDGMRDVPVTPSYIREREIERDKEIEIERETEGEVSLTDKALDICKYFESVSNGKSITQFVDDVKQIVSMYPNDWITEAIDIAVRNRVYSIAYIVKILKNWVSEGKREKGAARDGGAGQNIEASPYDFSRFGG